MRCLFLIALLVFTQGSRAQWHPQEQPLHKKDFILVAAKKYTMAFEYDITEGEKTLRRVLEFGVLGLPAGLYTKGTNDAGDSINIEETIYKFDGAGRLIKETNEDKIEGAEWTNAYTYTKEGKLLKKQTITIDPATTTYTYQAGKLLKSYTTQKMPAVNDNGEATGKTVERPQMRETFVYDKTGRLKEKFIYNLFGEEGGRQWDVHVQWTCNNKNQVIKRELFRTAGKPYYTESYEYDTNGLLIKAIVQGEDEPLQTFVYEYCTTCR